MTPSVSNLVSVNIDWQLVAKSKNVNLKGESVTSGLSHYFS